MFDFLLTDEQKALREEVRDLVRWVPRKMILDMDQDKVIVASEWYREYRRAKAEARTRDHEADAISADRLEEKDFGQDDRGGLTSRSPAPPLPLPWPVARPTRGRPRARRRPRAPSSSRHRRRCRSRRRSAA